MSGVNGILFSLPRLLKKLVWRRVKRPVPNTAFLIREALAVPENCLIGKSLNPWTLWPNLHLFAPINLSLDFWRGRGYETRGIKQ